MEMRPFQIAATLSASVLVTFLVGCDNGKTEQEIARLTTELELLNNEVKELTEKRSELTKERNAKIKSVRELEANQERAKNLLTDDQPIVDFKAALEDAIGEYEKELEEWRKETRASFKGMELPRVATKSGGEYQNVRVIKVTEDSLIIALSAGEEVIPLEELNEELRLKFIHEPTVLETQID
ncbi:MAG: hypothetical protein HKN23_09650 [Verrucomicrobiales bacterium]|nr:hypothetical protein [Verrucomicrobiales bacterium]